ncbi:MAG: hypothetical protein ACRD4Q_12940 [Candidatus Acidiferrales bacterium]
MPQKKNGSNGHFYVAHPYNMSELRVYQEMSIIAKYAPASAV